MVRSNAAESFEWPPIKDAQTSQVVELSSQGGEPTQRPSESVASARVAVRREEGPVPSLPERPQEDVHVALRHLLQQRASAAKASPQALPLPRSRSHLSSRVVPVVLVAVSLTALLEAAYIVRTLWRQPTSSAANSPQTPRPHDTSATAPAPERVAVVPLGSNAPPSPTSVAGVSGARPLSTTGRLVFRSDPSGAQVFVDGRLYGVTPLTLGTVVAGEHRVLLKRNATELRQIVRVEPGHTISVVAPMPSNASPSGWIAIDLPVEVDVFENGALLGTSRSRQIMLEAGPHTLDLVSENLAFRHTQQVRVEAGRVAHIGVALPESTINLNAVPWAEVLIDGKSVGETPIGNLPIVIGTHQVVFRHPELGERTVSATVKAGVATRVSADLRREPAK